MQVLTYQFDSNYITCTKMLTLLKNDLNHMLQEDNDEDVR